MHGTLSFDYIVLGLTVILRECKMIYLLIWSYSVNFSYSSRIRNVPEGIEILSDEAKCATFS